MSVQPKLITLNEYNPRNSEKEPINSIYFIHTFGKDQLSVFADEVLKALVEVYKEDGEIEIVKMVGRGQVFQSQAERVLGAKRYKEVGKLVPCQWD